MQKALDRAVAGVDFTRIDDISTTAAQVIVGPSVTAFPSEHGRTSPTSAWTSMHETVRSNFWL
jgi:hypothetical protein